MSEPKLISPMLDNFRMGDPISDHNGVRCCPAMDKDADDKYIVKIISVPANQTQLDALLLSGAYSNTESALSYFKSVCDGIVQEAEILQQLSQLEGFIPFAQWQIEPMEDGNGFDVYLLSRYRSTLQRYLRRNPMTHLGALNLGIDLCAALAICRRAGYLYADLKPDNIYITDNNAYRIGDIGFIKLDSLKYASLPDRYRSAYTAPEISDAFSALNTTIDIYALGLILYQAYNDGVLPFRSETAPAEQFPAPAYADYEMAEIILKACAPDPQARWQDPIEMGQALVAYMQRNGANDTPIVPVAETEAPSEVSPEEETGVFEADADSDCEQTEAPAEPEEAVSEDDLEITAQEITEESIYTEDSEGNLTFLADDTSEETVPESELSEIDYEEVTEEVSDMLSMADDLIAHQAPEPVVQPEPIDVPIPAPLPIEEAPAEDAVLTEQEAENTEDSETSEEVEETPVDSEIPDEDEPSPADKGTVVLRWIAGVLVGLAVLALLVGGFYLYKNYYLQPIDSFTLEENADGNLVAHISTPVDESMLSVVRYDTYGNHLSYPVSNGKVLFTDLASDTAYTFKLDISGFHRLTGTTTATYKTPAQTNIVQFSAVTGAEDGSAVLQFTIDGPDSTQWTVRYAASGEAEQEVAFSGHTLTLTGLTVGSEYTFTLLPENDLYIVGTDTITFTASKIITPTELQITGCTNGTLTATWSAPKDTSVDSWTVRCYSDNGFDETVTVTETAAVFENIDDSASYTVEVTAAGMSVSERAYAAANAITVTDFSADTSDPNRIVLTWNTADAEPTAGWILLYTVDGSAAQELSCQSEKTVTVSPAIPGAVYAFTLQTADGNSVLGGKLSCTMAEPQAFSGYGVSAENMEFRMCRTPSQKNWNRYNLTSSSYTTEFAADEKASFLVHLNHAYSTSTDTIVTLFVIRDENGNIVNASTSSDTWTNMWYRNYCELNVPSIPQASGNYTISIYFNGAFAGQQNFSIVSE